MNSKLYWFLNSLILIIPLLMDRVSKQLIVNGKLACQPVNDYLYFDLIYNRGISWGMLNSENNLIFFLVTLLVTTITVFLIWHTWQKIQQNQIVIGEILVLSGAISNIMDRVIYKGVVDFIIFSCNGWSWPAFNIADFSIVIGAVIMFITSIWEKPEQPIIKI
ncbi:MAG: signal peptidase II [Candidatus Babeliales bacterium]|nr:signal peptidase II [Candidatus Babeliales bacterium]